MSDFIDLESARDHFELFGLARAFDIDAGALEGKYLELTRRTHPDFAGADPEKQMAAMDLSARVNDAHKVLANPEERANYLLGLMGGPGKEEDKSLPAGFLQKMLMVREELEEAQEAGNEGTMAAMEKQAREERERRIERLSGLFKLAGGEAGKRGEIRTELNALRYIERMLEQIRPGDRGVM